MKVLFAVSSESISDAIIKRYQKDYKEILSYKNVYYFNAILKEIQKDKSYDRIVISEDLEPFSNNNYDAMDKFIFEKLDNISDEAHDSQGKETSIILICTDRHTKSSSFLVKLFGIGVYNALLGNDRSMDQVCKLISQPRVKKEAKMYYKIDAEDVNYDPSSEKEVSELEIQNILTHFKKIAKNKEKYADSFNNIASQYTDDQLKIIVNCLPINVKAVLEEESPKYQELMSASKIQRVGGKASVQVREEAQKAGIKIDILESKLSQPKISGPIVIPSSVKTAGKKGPVRVTQVNNIQEPEETIEEKKVVKIISNKLEEKVENLNDDDLNVDNLLLDTDELEDTNEDISLNETEDVLLDEEDLSLTLDEDIDDEEEVLLDLNLEDEENETEEVEENKEEITFSLDEDDEIEEIEETEEKEEIIEEEISEEVEEKNENISEKENRTIKRGRGRPRKTPVDVEPKPKGKRGRPRKNITQVEEINQIEEEKTILTPDMFSTPNNVSIPEDEENDDSLILSFEEDVDIDDDDELLSIPVEENDDDDDDTLLISADFDEEDDSELSMPELDDLDDLDDISIGIDYEDIDESNYLLTENAKNENIEEDDSLLISLDEDVENYEETDLDDDSLLIETDFEEDDDNLLISTDVVEDDDDLLISTNLEEDEEDDDSLLMDSNFGLENDDDDLLNDLEDFENIDTVSNETSVEEEPILNSNNNNYNNIYNKEETNKIDSIKPKVDYSMSALNSLLTKDKKIVTFIGTTKNGTSFLINNLAALFSSLGINTAILDMTQNRNSYYIYTKNEEELRKIAYTSIDKLENGYAEGIRVDKNLTIYTSLPNNGKNYTNAEAILSTLVQNHSLILVDCDFETDPAYFASCQEIYLVQSMDILTIQPLTSFLRDLKAKGVLESEKVRVVINKELKVKSLTTKIIIGGMSFYNDPAMAFMTELFNKDMVKACTIPFEDITYSKYLDGMVNCNVSLNGYSKAFLSKLRVLGDMVYPLTSRQTYSKPMQNYNKNAFSNSMNDTLNQMKNKF